jgi:hypothetical protein
LGVLDANDCIDRIVVASHEFVSLPLPGGAVVAHPLLHFQPIGVSVEHSFIVDVIVGEPEDDFLALAVFDVDAVDM